MILLDVNVLVYAHREDAPDHRAYLSWLEDLINSDQAYGLSDIVLSGFIRIVTHPKVFTPAAPFTRRLRLHRNYAANLTVWPLLQVPATGTSFVVSVRKPTPGKSRARCVLGCTGYRKRERMGHH